MSQHDEAAARASEHTASDAMAVLSRRVWRPIAPLVDSKSITRLRIAPDGLLNLVPFEALSDGRQLIDRFAISYVPAGRDLALATPSMPLSPPVVVVSPGVSRTAGAVQASISSFRTSELGRLDAADDEAAD
ncbi:MAG TPA: CHAT domain-containing protein, partial [Gemmatimonadaceae bacterium]